MGGFGFLCKISWYCDGETINETAIVYGDCYAEAAQKIEAAYGSDLISLNLYCVVSEGLVRIPNERYDEIVKENEI